MPWRETSPMQERVRFVRDCQSGLYEMTELCERYGISRKTGYKWPNHFLKRLVSASGAIGIHHRPIFISSALAGEWLGLEEVDEEVWSVRFCQIELGRYDRRRHRFTAPAPSASRGGPGGSAPRTPN